MDKEYYFKEGYNNLLKGEYGVAIELFSKAIQLDLYYLDAYFYRGLSYKNKGNLEDAIKDFNKVIDLNRKFVKAYYYRGHAFFQEGNFDKAICDFNKVIGFEPNHKDALSYRGMSYSNLGKYGEAISDLNIVIGINTDDLNARYNRGVAFSKKGNYEAALYDFDKVIELDPNFVIAYYNRGNIFSEKNNFIDAIKDYNKAIELSPKNSIAYYNRGNTYLKMDNYENAIDDFNKAIEFAPKDMMAYYNRGLTNIKICDYKNALNDFNKVLEFDCNSIQAYINRGTVYFEMNNYEDAINDFNKALLLDPNEKKIYNNRGLAYFKNGNITIAISDFDKAIDFDPSYADAYFNRGIIWLKIGDNDKALNDFNKAIEFDINHIEAYYNRAYLYNSMKEYQKGFENLVIVEELCINNSKLYKYSKVLLNFFSYFTAPFILNRIIEKLDDIDSFLSYKSLISQNLRECSDIISLLNYYEKTNQTENSKFQLLKGVVTYYMKDPSVCYKILDKNININIPSNLMGQYYYILSCEDYLKSDRKHVLKHALESANNYLDDRDKSFDSIQLYYAGQIFFKNMDYNKALECFINYNEFIPSLCMQVLCYDLLGDITIRDSKINELIFLDKHDKGLLPFSFLPKLSIDGFEESVIKYANLREIESVVLILSDYTEGMIDILKTRYEITIPQASEIFSIEKDSVDGKNTIETLSLWKKEVIDGFCIDCEIIFENNIKDHFEQWKKVIDKNDLELALGAEIPYFCLKEELKPYLIDLIDYFSVKKKLNDEARYLLAFWAEISKYRNNQLTDNQKRLIKLSIGYTFKIVIGYFGLPYLVPSLVLYVGEQFTKEAITEKIIKFIQMTFIESDAEIPEYYTDFKCQFEKYLRSERS